MITLTILHANQSEKVVQVTDIFTGQIYQTYNQYGDSIRYIDITNEGNRLVLLTDDGIKVFETFTGKEIYTYNSECYSLSISNDGQSMMIVNDWKGAILVDIENQSILAAFSDFYALGSRVFFSPSDQYGLIMSRGYISKTEHIEGEIKLIDIRNKTIKYNLSIEDEMFTVTKFTPCGKYIISSGDSLGTLTIWDVESGKILTQTHHGREFAYDIDFLPNGSKFVLIFDDNYSQMWDFSAFAPSGVDDYSLYR